MKTSERCRRRGGKARGERPARVAPKKHGAADPRAAPSPEPPPEHAAGQLLPRESPDAQKTRNAKSFCAGLRLSQLEKFHPATRARRARPRDSPTLVAASWRHSRVDEARAAKRRQIEDQGRQTRQAPAGATHKVRPNAPGGGRPSRCRETFFRIDWTRTRRQDPAELQTPPHTRRENVGFPVRVFPAHYRPNTREGGGKVEGTGVPESSLAPASTDSRRRPKTSSRVPRGRQTKEKSESGKPSSREMDAACLRVLRHRTRTRLAPTQPRKNGLPSSEATQFVLCVCVGFPPLATGRPVYHADPLPQTSRARGDLQIPIRLQTQPVRVHANHVTV